MKNILLKTILVFVVMTIFNTGFVDETVKFLKLPGGDFGMLSLSILIGCGIVSVVGLVTVFIFKQQYHSLWKIALLFEVLYLLMLILSGTNPFTYFLVPTNPKLLSVLLYANSIGVFLIMVLFDLIYSKVIGSKSKN
ncbi:hypothetical protein [Chryseobacterium sp. SIMBA_029]|uniref:hypothetical protein n=1 Tax=Chryseobacterium sp. SIMBA_029 TaxID=3085772 RepID=UPI00397902F3